MHCPLSGGPDYEAEISGTTVRERLAQKETAPAKAGETAFLALKPDKADSVGGIPQDKPVLQQPLAQQAQADADRNGAARRMVVIHPGFFSKDDNCSASALRQSLIDRGIPPGDVIILDSPYPPLSENADPAPAEPAQGWRDTLRRWGQKTRNFFTQTQNLYRNVQMYLQFQDPASVDARAAYQRLSRAIPQSANPRPQVTFIGFSGGGQVGLTMARMAEGENRFNLDQVVTLGSPIMFNPAPRQVRVHSFVSSGDGVLNSVSALPYVYRTPPNLDSNDKIHRFGRHIHHFAWYQDRAVLDTLFQAVRPQPVP